MSNMYINKSKISLSKSQEVSLIKGVYASMFLVAALYVGFLISIILCL